MRLKNCGVTLQESSQFIGVLSDIGALTFQFRLSIWLRVSLTFQQIQQSFVFHLEAKQ